MFIIKVVPSLHGRRIRSAPSKISSQSSSKVNGSTNPVRIPNRIQQMAVTASPDSALFRLNTIIVQHV